MWKALQTGLFLLQAFIYVNGDIFMHNPRGSNNRLNENSRGRKNNNRMFDSQNNNNGGYNVGDATSAPAQTDPKKQYQMKYFQSGPSELDSSYLRIEWTNQHGCGAGRRNPKLNCNIVIQYMCQPTDKTVAETDKFRDGVTTQQQPYTANAEKSQAVNNRGLHENWEWYKRCANRENNGGLFVADQKIKGVKSATKTRQNRNGKRSGYECPEERDYYPYWHPTPWIDIAVLSETVKECKTYYNQSFNKRSYEECIEKVDGNKFIRLSKWNNPDDCKKNGGTWQAFHNYLEKATQYTTEKACMNAAEANMDIKYFWGLPADTENPSKYECLVPAPNVICKPAPFTRVNHLGNSMNGQTGSFNWKLPYFPSMKDQRCVLRIRYNISTDDPEEKIVNNPTVVFNEVPLKLAINSAQFGRTFQDRSHVFILKPRTPDMKGQLFNLNVRGKRGNIVQAFPAVEYDFVPNKLMIKRNDMVHIQWTGSNTNPKNFAGEGTAGTDRNNFLEMQTLGMSYPLLSKNMKLCNNSDIVWSHTQKTGLSVDDLAINLASSGYYADVSSVGKMDKLNNVLNNAPASYEGVVLRVTKAGMYYYMCTRNNNFTNRSQKGTLIVA